MASYFTRYDKGVRLNCGKEAFDEWYYAEMGNSWNRYTLDKKNLICSDKHGYLLLQYSAQNLNKIYPNYSKNVYTVPRAVVISRKQSLEQEPWVEFVLLNFIRANFPGVILTRIIEVDGDDPEDDCHAGMMILERSIEHMNTILMTTVDSSTVFNDATLRRLRARFSYLIKQSDSRLVIVQNNDYIKNHQKGGYCVYNAYVWTMMYLLQVPVSSTDQERKALKEDERVSSRDQICKRTMNSASIMAVSIGERCVDQKAEFPLSSLFSQLCSFPDINSALRELFREWIDIFTVPYETVEGEARTFLFSQPPTHEHFLRCLTNPQINNTIEAYQYFFDVQKIYCSE